MALAARRRSASAAAVRHVCVRIIDVPTFEARDGCKGRHARLDPNGRAMPFSGVTKHSHGVRTFSPGAAARSNTPWPRRHDGTGAPWPYCDYRYPYCDYRYPYCHYRYPYLGLVGTTEHRSVLGVRRRKRSRQDLSVLCRSEPSLRDASCSEPSCATV